MLLDAPWIGNFVMVGVKVPEAGLHRFKVGVNPFCITYWLFNLMTSIQQDKCRAGWSHIRLCNWANEVGSVGLSLLLF
jgi:hypothetical protein